MMSLKGRAVIVATAVVLAIIIPRQYHLLAWPVIAVVALRAK